MTFGKRLQELRKERGLTQEDLAAALNITPQSVSKWENDLSTPDLATLVNLAKLLGVSCDYLLGNQIETLVTKKDPNKLILKIVVKSNSNDKVKINLPLSVVKILLKDGNLKINDNDTLSKIDFDLVFMMIDEGTIGKLIEVESADGDYVSIFVE